MAISKNKETKTAAYAVKVTRAKDLTKDGKTCIAFDMEVNDVSIYGCFYREAVNKKGETFYAVSFPSHKADDGKYYSYAFFKISDELLADIEKQIEALI